MNNTDRFDAAAATWDDNPRRAAIIAAVAEAIRSHVPLSRDMTMLDFGCGTAALSVLLADQVCAIDAVDTSSGMIAEVQRKLSAAPELAAVISASVLTGPAEKTLHGKWGLICTAMVMHHIEDLPGTLRHLADCLCPGGYLAVADLYSEDGSFHGQDAVPHHGFDPHALAGLLENAGLVQNDVSNVLTFSKPCDDGVTREFSIFLLTCRHPADEDN